VKRLLRNPLLHFAVIGIALFAVFRSIGGSEEDARSTIRLSAADQAALEARWEQQWGRSPTDDELQGLIEDRVREEILYREALSLGLDRDDTIVRRRLAQKMEFLASDAAAIPEPGDDELLAFLEQHAGRFRIPGRVTFEQIYFGRDTHGAELAEVAKRALAAARAGESVEGDRLLLPRRQERVTASRVGQVFGEGFGEAVMRLAPGRWEGPIASAYGLHVVFVEESRPARTPALDEVRPAVRREWEASRRKEESQAFYRDLRARYPVEIEGR
jgi:hypothetical protein